MDGNKTLYEFKSKGAKMKAKKIDIDVERLKKKIKELQESICHHRGCWYRKFKKNWKESTNG